MKFFHYVSKKQHENIFVLHNQYLVSFTLKQPKLQHEKK